MDEYTPAWVCELLGITPRQLAYLLDLSAIDIEGKRDALSAEEVEELAAYLPVPDDDWLMDRVLAEVHAQREALDGPFP
jgi:hypothetical protein